MSRARVFDDKYLWRIKERDCAFISGISICNDRINTYLLNERRREHRRRHATPNFLEQH
jgi:hypothetical protein